MDSFLKCVSLDGRFQFIVYCQISSLIFFNSETCVTLFCHDVRVPSKDLRRHDGASHFISPCTYFYFKEATPLQGTAGQTC